jgi:hypothetical protein
VQEPDAGQEGNMKNVIITVCAALLVAVPATMGLIGNTSFSQSIPVRPPANASLVDDSAHPDPVPTTTEPTKIVRPRTVPNIAPSPAPRTSDDKGGQRLNRTPASGDNHRGRRGPSTTKRAGHPNGNRGPSSKSGPGKGSTSSTSGKSGTRASGDTSTSGGTSGPGGTSNVSGQSSLSAPQPAASNSPNDVAAPVPAGDVKVTKSGSGKTSGKAESGSTDGSSGSGSGGTPDGGSGSP